MLDQARWGLGKGCTVTIHSMRISGEGITRWGLTALRGHDEMYDAHAAISCLHDALLAVVKGDITPEQAREFFWKNDLADAKYIGDVVSFELAKTSSCLWPACGCSVTFPEGAIAMNTTTMCPKAAFPDPILLPTKVKATS